MNKIRENYLKLRQNLGLFLALTLIGGGVLLPWSSLPELPQQSELFAKKEDPIEVDFKVEDYNLSPITIQENTIFSLSSPSFEEEVKRIRMVITAYSSSPQETDSDPFVTAAGTRVREGIVANNLLPFGSKVRIPELYGEKVFVVEDRMHWRKGYYHLDIWFSSREEALNFGSTRTYVEVLEN